LDAVDSVSEATLEITVIRKDGSSETETIEYKRPWYKTLKRKLTIWRP
jgi:hypothetical protein